jgi:ketosteroid isomerase-like protein
MPLEELQCAFLGCCSTLGVARQYASWFSTTATHNGSAHIELHGSVFHWIVTERGQELERRETSDLDEVLYWLMSDVTFNIATRHELHNRRPGEDTRRQLFAEQERLLNELRPEWAAKYRVRVAQILSAHPFVDR